MNDLSGLVEFIPNDFFLTSREEFSSWASGQKKLIMENFYQEQRRRLNILMDGNTPVGGQWNYDKENRQPLPKGHQFPEYLSHEMDELDCEILQELKDSSFNLWGSDPDLTWSTRRDGARNQLNHFLENNFALFGPYEDAMTTENWSLHHSLLTPYLNIGLLHPQEAIDAAVKKFESGSIPIASAEGFIRQIIGWREYINGVYWHFGESYKNNNALKLNRPLLPLFSDPSKTSMNCLTRQVSDIQQRGWVHHIPRLMILSNIALLAGVNPQEFLAWMREVFLDAAEWVMVPNVIGMGMHSDGGQMMTKPYVSGGSYISKMSNYCKSCVYDPKIRVSEKACPFTNLSQGIIECFSNSMGLIDSKIWMRRWGRARESCMGSARDQFEVSRSAFLQIFLSIVGKSNV
jgi:deoxyribodipyrimidine photolyase-related protein